MTDVRRSGSRLSAALHEDRHVLLVAVLFLGLGALWLGSPAHYFSDERYYTDSALRMLERGDPWTPMWAWGEARLNKPLLTYWVVMGTYVTAGVSMFLSRLPFLVAGALLVWITARLARVLFPRQPAVVLLAACIMAGNIEIVTLARRSTPDILLILAATATLFGLTRILVAREAGVAPRLWLWIGAGVAVATKGGLGVLVVVFALAIAFLLRVRAARGPAGSAVPASVRVRELLSPVPMLIGLAIALVAVLPGVLASGPSTGPTLLQDQIGTRLAASPAAVLGQLVKYAGALAKHFAPWLLLLVAAWIAAAPALRARWRSDRRAFAIAFAWTALLVVVFALANTHRGRYLAPAHPILACVLAAWLCDAAGTALVRRTARGLAVALFLVGTAAGLALVRIDATTALSVLIVPLVMLVGWKLEPAPADDTTAPMRALALGLLAAVAVAGEAVRELTDPSPVPEACARMLSAGELPARTATVGFFETTASQMRVVSGGRLDPAVLAEDVTAEELAPFDALLATQAARPALEQAGYSIETTGRVAPNLKPAQAWRWLTADDPAAWLGQHGEPALLGVRTTPR